jgi:hypothetical protein
MYKTIEDLEAVNFQKLEQEDRLNIILKIVDESNDIRNFKDYFLKEDMDILRKRNRQETISYNNEDVQ